MTLSVRSRFEVFKRDGFTCGYCGKTPDDEGVKLEVDHITPRSAGGGDEITNLVTSCWDCNHGKAAKGLDDKAPSLTQAMVNTRERALQLEEYRRWQGALDSVNNDILVRVWDAWIEAFGGKKTQDPEHPTSYTWEPAWVEFPSDGAILRQLDTLELSQVLQAVEIAGAKYRSFDLHHRDASRYFFGVLRNMRQQKQGGLGELSAREDQIFGVAWEGGKKTEHARIGLVIKRWRDHGYDSLEDAILAEWPEDD